MLRALPGDSRRWGPPRRSGFAADVARAAGGRWIEVVAPSVEAPYRTVVEAADQRVLAKLRPKCWRAAGVAEIPGARVVSPHGFAVGSRDTLLVDAGFSSGAPASETWRLPRVERRRALHGNVLNLCSTWAPYNFAHQLLDVWPRCELVRRAGWDWPDFAHVLVPDPLFPVSQEVLERIGVPREKCVAIGRAEEVHCERLVQPTHPSGTTATHYPQWVADFFTALGWPAAPHAPRRLYVSRGRGVRRVANEAELVAALSAEGFTVVDAAELGTRAPGWFAGAEEIVGAHGAGLAHVVFASASASLVEIFTPEHVSGYYASLSHARGMGYGAVAGGPLRGGAGGTSFTVDVAKVIRVLGGVRRSRGA